MYESLGLRSIRVTDPGTGPWGFDWLRRELAEPPAFATHVASWLFGERDGVAIVVRPVSLPGDAENPCTAIVAEIDPPLFTGLRMFSRSLAQPFRFESPTFVLGVPMIDRPFVVRVHDKDRALRLFARGGVNDNFAWSLGDAGTKKNLLIDDRTVASYVIGRVPSEAHVEEDLEVVSYYARHFAERVPSLPERPEEHEARESWARAAAGWSLVFDPARWKISGEHEGRRIDVTLEGIPPSVATIVRVSFRLPLGVGLFVRSGLRDKKMASRSGHSDLDEHLLYDARDGVKAQQAIADPAVRSALAEEARIANVTMTDRGITSARGGFLRGREVSARIEALSAIVDRITPQLRTAGPFR